MTAATRARRHLAAVNDDYVPAAAAVSEPDVKLAAVLVRRRTLLAEDYDDACIAALAPDVIEQQRDLISNAMSALATPGADLHAVLLDYGRRMYVTGHMDAAADGRTVTGPTEFEAETLAAIYQLEAHTRREKTR